VRARLEPHAGSYVRYDVWTDTLVAAVKRKEQRHQPVAGFLEQLKVES
jgi:hypothetical protein